ncbi:DUF1003 domain-containing protein [Bailinhaonella thermotolerans]|uniref:DUF1003 domain-containing protein n=1 Tax=Bailinhaonella thermotolerans TaxID=1070861 RepID=A0A3A4B554_9ACTN|nr:DUF1003 domain-containing protein [Bailinhaonella thermotolerans]RJL33467.1 DUF1003 domain-containing protein [Bailinhaonella thermotolerans]
MALSNRLDQPRDVRRPLVALPHYDPETFGRLSERIARFLGTARFLVYMTGFVALWVGWNILAPANLRFDPYPFIFLTLMLSLQASYAAPLILLAQNRQADRDRVQYENDRLAAERNQADTEYLTREIAALRIAVGEVATRDFIRAELARLLEDRDDRDREPRDKESRDKESRDREPRDREPRDKDAREEDPRPGP